MDEYLSEKEQIEQIREWFRENGWYLVAGVALTAIGLFGVNQYRNYSESRAEAAAALYLDLQDVLEDDDRTAAEALLTELREEYAGSPYTDQAGLLMAGAYLVREPDRAVDELRYVIESTADRELGLIARMRLARVLIFQSSYDEALSVLNVRDVGPFAAQFSEIRGDAYYALGDFDAARDAYSNALIAPGAEWLNRAFVEMKLDELDTQTSSEESGA